MNVTMLLLTVYHNPSSICSLFFSTAILILVVVVECCDVLEISELVVLDFYAYFCTRIPGRMSTFIEICYLCVDKSICGWVIFNI